MRQVCFVFLLLLMPMSRLSFAQTWDEARATMAENIRICEMILANPAKYPGINISTINTFHYYYINVPTVQTNLDVLNSINAGVAAAIAGYYFPPAVSVNVVPLDYASMVNQILGRIQLALIAAIGLFLSTWGLIWFYRKFKHVASVDDRQYERNQRCEE